MLLDVVVSTALSKVRPRRHREGRNRALQSATSAAPRRSQPRSPKRDLGGTASMPAYEVHELVERLGHEVTICHSSVEAQLAEHDFARSATIVISRLSQLSRSQFVIEWKAWSRSALGRSFNLKSP